MLDIDWYYFYLPACLALLRGETLPTLFNPPWVLAPLIPFALLPNGHYLMMAVAFAAFAYAAWRLGAKPLSFPTYLLSPPILYSIMFGNIEWLVVLGFVATPSVALLLMALKPQMTFLLLPYVITKRSVAALGMALVLSTILFPRWIPDFFSYTQYRGNQADVNVFPYLLPLALFLIFRRKTMAASPMFSPVLTMGSWVVVSLSMVRKPFWCAAFALGAWLFFILTRVR